MGRNLVDGSDKVITTSEGRSVGFRRYGADTEPSLLYLHGCPGSRAEVRLYEPDLLEDLGICVVAVDRAGYGLTESASDWDVLARVRDAVAVAGAVGMSTFTVQGTSAGGAYALAVAASVPDRVRSVILAGGQGRLDTDWAFDDMPAEFAESWREELRDPEGSRQRFETEMLAFRNAPDIVGAWLDMTSHMTDDERAFVASCGDALIEDTLEATRQGAMGYWLDGQTRGRPWPFAVDTIQAPIHVFHGDRDGWNPLPALRRSLVGAAHIHEHIYAGGDHLSPWTTRERRRAMLSEIAR
ncbi:MAG TPA: alpha/beta hydrolase [Candidatus Dormibacteraeota bacterium]